ncbi:S1C family serine protease [Deinococcus yavapaiensis]|uniref:S1-C subfamily serine protease n=1 Tax=Deinococcus yavapaiensis KR-236 TaxID=694435 RepID=A0A318SJY3_9DEIO|nr:S1C family serine protease [Deinococcus yavapaiensis]PYE52868.1 S1-C subfamily serine protease [Deinococcus yavapaiensis KR-236]
MSKRLRALTALLTAFLLVPIASAQTAPSVAQARQGGATTTTPRVGADVFDKTRSAAFRIEGDNGVGTGFFISNDGFALTAYHVVFDAKNPKAITVDKKEYAFDVIGFDDYNDVALLKVKVTGNVPFLPLAKASPKVGDAVLGVGNGGGSFLTAKYGNLQALGVDAGRADFPNGTLEMTAPLIPGDSGGPIINANGEAVGITSYIRATDRSSWRSYAVPMTEASVLLRDLRSGVKRDAPVLGIQWVGYDLQDAAYAQYGLGKRPGVIVAAVTKGGPAEQAGLRSASGTSRTTIKADVIVEVAGKATPTWDDLINVVRSKKIGDLIPVTVQRGDETVVLNLRLGSRAQLFGAVNP